MNNDSYLKILEQVRSLIQEVSLDEAYRLLKERNNVTLVDIRELEEIVLGYIKGSVSKRGVELDEKDYVIGDETLRTSNQ